MMAGAWNKILLSAGALTVAGVVSLVLSDAALGTTEYMTRLPAYSTYRCAICHTSSSPVPPSADLNPFGVDFMKNAFVWNDSLALANSDGDKCPNGFELGDMDGDGVLDEAGGTENGNPGVPDCNITLTEKTWGIIKQLFSGD